MPACTTWSRPVLTTLQDMPSGLPPAMAHAMPPSRCAGRRWRCCASRPCLRTLCIRAGAWTRARGTRYWRRWGGVSDSWKSQVRPKRSLTPRGAPGLAAAVARCRADGTSTALRHRRQQAMRSRLLLRSATRCEGLLKGGPWALSAGSTRGQHASSLLPRLLACRTFVEAAPAGRGAALPALPALPAALSAEAPAGAGQL